jgi:hypothetical protein
MTNGSGDFFRWEDIDRRILSPKTNALVAEMHKRAAEEERKIQFEVAQSGNQGAYLSRLFDFHEALANEWVERLYAIHCEVWVEQNQRISPAFIRAVRGRSIITTLAARKNSVRSQVTMRGVRTGKPPNLFALKKWDRRMDRLAHDWSSKLEGEAAACEYRIAAEAASDFAARGAPKSTAPAVAAPLQWEKATPDHLIPAIKRIRESFELSSWKYSTITRKYCYGVLHPKEVNPSSLAPHKDFLETYRMVIGPVADKQFTDLCRVGTPPALFKAFFDALRKGLEIEIQAQFEEVLGIARSNAQALNTHAVEWSKAHLQALASAEREVIKRWIKGVCDTQDRSNEPSTDANFDELIFWKEWRAPRLIHMQPSGSTAYDPATEWMREDEPRSTTLLESLSGRFVQFLEIELERIAGDAYVKLAQSGETLKVPQQRDPRPQSISSATSQTSQSSEPVEKERREAQSGDTRIPWEQIEIRFLSDHRVQVRKGTENETLNYCEFGFEDSRSGKPSMAWELLLTLAKERGILRDGRTAGQPWQKVEKRIQEIRKVFRNRFGLTSDPLPFVEGTGYTTRFRISCGPSYET